MITRWYLRRDPAVPSRIWLQMDEVAGHALPRGITCRVFDRLDARAQLPFLRRTLEAPVALAARAPAKMLDTAYGDA